MSDGVSPASLMAAAAAAVAIVAVDSSAAAIRRSLIPVRSVIHWSLVSSVCSSSALVRRCSGA